MRQLVALFSLILTPAFLFAQTRVDFNDVAQHRSATEFEFDSAALARLPNARLELEHVPISYDETQTVILAPLRSPIDASTRVFVGDDAVTLAACRGFVGEISGEPNSRVVVALSGRYVFMSIERAGRSPMMLCPALSRSNGAHILISQADLFATDTARNLICLNEDLPELDRLSSRTATLPLSAGKTLSTHSLLECEVAVEADSCFFVAAGGSVDLVTAYINALFAMSSAIYEDEAQITFHIPWLKLWSSGDPYNVKGNAYALPDTVRSYWKTHYTDVERDIAHVMTSIGYGGGGFGWFGMCGTDYGYSVSSPRTHEPFPTFAFTYDAYIVSHEIGHNFGLPHSHACYWNPPLDTCYTNDDAALKLSDACYGLPITPRKNPGTIMSYCANANYQLSGNDFSQYKLQMTFSPRVADTLRRNAESYTCITEPASATVRLLSPRGGLTLPGDTTIRIQWTSAHVSNIDLAYSSNAGQSWTKIAQNVLASDGSLDWRVPNTSMTNGLVIITDATNALVSDTSLLPISIAAHAGVQEIPVSTAIEITQDAIAFPNALSHSDFEIYDLLGNTVRKGPVEHNVQLHDIARGAYILRVTHDQGVQSYRFIH